MNPRAYAESVLSGEVVAGQHVHAAARRQLADLDSGADRGLRWDDQAAADGLDFFRELLVMPDTRQPFALFGWQEFLVGCLFGWRRADGTRRFRRVYLETAKGSGKSPLAAGLALRAICADGLDGAEAYMIARTAEQALVTFRHAVRLLESTPLLAERLTVIGGAMPYRIVDPVTHSFLTRVASTKAGRGQSGALAHCVIVDEYHEHEDAAMRDMYDAATKSDAQPLVITTTNAGVDLRSACGVEHTYAARVAAGEMQDDEYLALIYSVDGDDDPLADEAVWVKSNPSLPLLPGPDYLRSQTRKAQGMPSKRSQVERLNFSRWVDSAAPWVDPDVWRRCLTQAPLPDRERYPCYLGLDLSAKTDLTAGAVVWDRGDCLEAEVRCWTPADTLAARAESDGQDYHTWVARGFLTTVPGKIMDYSYPVEWINDLFTRQDVRALAYDPWRIDLLEQALELAGLRTTRDEHGVGIRMIPHPQGFIGGAVRARSSDLDREREAQTLRLWMPRSVDATEAALLDSRLRVVESAPLNAAVTGIALAADASGNRRPVKNRSTNRIDPALALIMAVGCAGEFRRQQEALEVTAAAELIF